MDAFIGRIGKTNSLCLASDCQFVVHDAADNKFIAVKTLQEAVKYSEKGVLWTIYVWQAGIWNPVHFLVLDDRPIPAIGFQGNEP
jgi:hypothetical protein